MAESQQSSDASSPPAQLVGNAFVPQYYQILHHSPGLMHRFYREDSKLTRPEANGQMSSVTTQKAIDEKILSMDFARAEIKTVDSQDSHCGGVTVLVTGHIVGKDNIGRDFAQSFFLAPQEKGYFVLNDIFRYVGSSDGHVDCKNDNDILPNGFVSTIILEEEVNNVQPDSEQQVESPAEEDPNDGVSSPEKEGTVSTVEEEEPTPEVIDEASNGAQEAPAAPPAPASQDGAQKRSYASIVKVMKENPAPFAPAPIVTRSLRPKPEKSAVSAPAPAPAPVPVAASVVDAPLNLGHSDNSSAHESEEDAGHSIYIRGLPLNATAAQLEEVFRKFGNIKLDGIQVRSHKMPGICYGFVDFEEASAAQNAIRASPVMIGEQKAVVEAKKARSSRVGSRGRYQSGRGSGYWNEGSRGRGSYGGGRGYSRGDFSYRNDYGSRGGGRNGPSARGGDLGYQRVDGARGNRPGPATGDPSAK